MLSLAKPSAKHQIPSSLQPGDGHALPHLPRCPVIVLPSVASIAILKPLRVALKNACMYVYDLQKARRIDNCKLSLHTKKKQHNNYLLCSDCKNYFIKIDLIETPSITRLFFCMTRVFPEGIQRSTPDY